MGYYNASAYYNKAEYYNGKSSTLFLGGAAGYYHYFQPYHRKPEEKEIKRNIEETRNLLKETEQKLFEKEAARKAMRKVLLKKEALQQEAMTALLSEQIRNLRIQRDLLMRLIDEDEAILVLLLSMPFH